MGRQRVRFSATFQMHSDPKDVLRLKLRLTQCKCCRHTMDHVSCIYVVFILQLLTISDV